jgi:hypothetical protein
MMQETALGSVHIGGGGEEEFDAMSTEFNPALFISVGVSWVCT